jgi:hypothetical protein
MNEPEDVVVGIKAANAWPDTAVRPSGEDRHLANDVTWTAEAVGWLQTVHPQLIVVEATGGYEAPLVVDLVTPAFLSRWSTIRSGLQVSKARGYQRESEYGRILM